MCVFSPFDILLPRQEHLERWPVIACDQFTSQPAYWQEAEAYARGVPSALHCILPEAELEGCTDSRYAQICRTMEEYLAEGIFRSYPGSFVYTERTLHDGSIRSGIVGTVDLEAYDSGPCSSALRIGYRSVRTLFLFLSCGFRHSRFRAGTAFLCRCSDRIHFIGDSRS